MRWLKRLGTIALVCAAATALAAEATVLIELKNGETLEATLVSLKDRVFIVRIGKELREISEDQVRGIHYDRPRRLLPAPTPGDPADAQAIDVAVEDAPFRDAIAEIASRVGRAIFVDPRVDEKISVDLRKLSWRDAVAVMARMVQVRDAPFGEGSILIGGEPRVTGSLQDAEVRSVLAAIGAASGKQFVIAPDLVERTTADFHDLSWLDALESVVKACQLHVARTGSTVLVTRDLAAWGNPDLRAFETGRWPGAELHGADLEPGTAASKRIDLDVRDADLRDVCDEIGRVVGRNILCDPEVNVRTSLVVRHAPWHDVLSFLARAHGLTLEVRGAIVVVTAPPPCAIRLRSAPAGPTLRALAGHAGLNLVLAPGVTGRLADVDLRSVHWLDALGIVAATSGLVIDRAQDTITISADPARRARVLAALLPEARPATAAFARGARPADVPIRAIFHDPRPESRSRVVIGDEVLVEHDPVKDAKGGRALRIEKIEDGKVTLSLAEDRAIVELR